MTDDRSHTVVDRRFPLPLDALGTRYSLTDEQIARLALLAAELAFDEHAPTTVTAPRAVLDDHLADSLVALELREVRSARRIVDLGAGAGLPGLPLAIALPTTRVTLIDGNFRKCEFIRRVASLIGLDNAEVVNSRAETWSDGIGCCDLATARALGPLDMVEEYAAPLLTLGGTLVAWRGSREPQAEAAATRAAEILGLEVHEPVRVRPYPAAEHRHLHRLTKVVPTPDRFPRRDGVARKRPLGRG